MVRTASSSDPIFKDGTITSTDKRGQFTETPVADTNHNLHITRESDFMNHQLWDLILNGIEALYHFFELGHSHAAVLCEIIFASFGVSSIVTTIYQVMKRSVNKLKRAFVIFHDRDSARVRRIKAHCDKNALNLQKWILKTCEEKIKQDEN